MMFLGNGQEEEEFLQYLNATVHGTISYGMGSISSKEAPRGWGKRKGESLGDEPDSFM